MNDTGTVVDATEALEPCPPTEVAYAWGSERAEDFTVPAGQVDEQATGAPVLAVAAGNLPDDHSPFPMVLQAD